MAERSDPPHETGGGTPGVGAQQRAATDRRSRRRLSLFLQLGEAVGEREVPTALCTVARLLSRDVVDWALVLLVTSTPPRPGVEVVAAEGALAPAAGELVGQRLPHPGAGGGPDPLAALLDGSRRDVVELDLADPGEAPVVRRLAELVTPHVRGAAIALPVVDSTDVFGVVVVGPRRARPGDAPGPLAPEDADLLEEVVRRTARAMDDVRLRAREEALAETSQQDLLSGRAGVPGLDVWVHRAPDSGDPRPCGDWCDVLQTADDVAVFVVGDVVGEDVEAAAAMEQMRSVVRSCASESDDPGSVLMHVDQATAGLQIPRMASVVCSTLRRLDDGEWELSWSSAGHLPPLLLHPAGAEAQARVEVLSEATGTLVGLGDRPRPTRERPLSPGDVLVFYTDGLIERRQERMRDGLGAVVGALESAGAADAAGVGRNLLQALGEDPDDDTAVVVVRIPEAHEGTGPAATPRRRRWQLPAEPSSIGKARHATLRACAVWRLGCVLEAEIAVSELVANAVLHGRGPVSLRLFETDAGLRIEVEDESPQVPRVVQPRDDGSGGHGMRVVSRLGRWGWTPTRTGKVVWVELRSPRPEAADPGRPADPATD